MSTPSASSSKPTVLLAAGGASWEAAVLEAIESASSRVVLHRRCLDLADLLSAATARSASAAVIGASVVGLDADTVASLRRADVSVVVVHDKHDTTDLDRIARLGIDHLVAASDVDELLGLLEGASRQPSAQAGDQDFVARAAVPPEGDIVAVWGPTGAPGRTTLAVGLAAELAAKGIATMLVDADPYGGAVAQQLGVLDQVSGLLAAARLANAGRLDADRLALAARSLGEDLRVLSGLPRADRWVEVRARAYDDVLTAATALARYVVVDTGFSLEHDPDAYSTATPRNMMTVATLQRADHVVVVGAADPVGLTRLVRGLHDLAEVAPGRVPLVVVNRMRPGLGWSEHDVASMVAGVLPGAVPRFLPDDRAAADRALMAGRSLVETGDSALRRAVSELSQAFSNSHNPVTV